MPDALKILCVFDIHLSDGNPGYRTETYREDILRKLNETVTIAHEEGATRVLWLGDVFDNKAASRTSHRTVLNTADVLKAYNLPVDILVGNHDLAAGGSLDSLVKQPIGVLGRLPNVNLLTWDPLVLDEDVTLFPIPGVPIRQEDDWLRHYVTGSKVKRPIIVSHQLVARDLSRYPKPAQASFQDSREIALRTDACLVISGDLHSPQGVYVQKDGRGGNVGFANLGATCRLAADEVGHKPQVLLLTIEGDERRSLRFKEIPLKSVRPAEEVFRLEDHYEAKEHQADIDETIKRLKATRIHKFSIDAVMGELRVNGSVEAPVRIKAVELIEAIR